MRRNISVWRVASLITPPLLASCSLLDSRPEQGYVAKGWADNVTELGISPIYPPAERVYVGDLYIHLGSSLKNPFPSEFYLNNSRLFDRLDVSFIRAREAKTITFEEETSVLNEESGNATTLFSPKGLLLDSTRVTGLVAFPGFSFSSSQGVQGGVGIASSGWASAIGLAGESEYNVVFSVPAAEKEVLPSDAGLDIFVTHLSDPKVQHNLLILGSMLQTRYPEADIYASFLVEVYYAWAMDVSIVSKKGFGVETNLILSRLVDLSERQAQMITALEELTSGSGNGPRSGTSSSDSSADEQVKAEARTLEADIRKLQGEMRSAAAAIVPNAPGITGSVRQASGNSVTFRQSFPRPVAVGYRSITVSIEKGRAEVAALRIDSANYPLSDAVSSSPWAAKDFGFMTMNLAATETSKPAEPHQDDTVISQRPTVDRVRCVDGHDVGNVVICGLESRNAIIRFGTPTQPSPLQVPPDIMNQSAEKHLEIR
ncbi:hypothetical protein [Stutzerimonas stutzeri]|uniref:hypothetical protein n=1 Tax=Stutzerimonas stutzeri TaxID=316 RepID=UPI0015E4386A|nr:hypothetical protein [Stutzerimonas stutzeri]MBA1278122.1 hypothetical protein [Stutzerimonas stutzeri]